MMNDDQHIPEGPLNELISQFKKDNKSGMRLGMNHPSLSTESQPASFIFKKSILDYLHAEQELSLV